MNHLKGWLDLGHLCHFRLKKEKEIWGFWVEEASDGNRNRKSMMNKSFL